jgi:hypothetical protein
VPDKLPDQKLLISKFDAGRRQLKTAIRLWFEDDDPVAIHTLAAAAYEILHNLSRRKGGKDLLFDAKAVNEDYRKAFVKKIKSTAQFFKHADRDPDGVIELSTLNTETFMMYSLVALNRMGEKLMMGENAMLSWISFSNPQIIAEDVRKNIPANVFEQFASLTKRQFLQEFSNAWNLGLFRGDFTFITP